MSDQSSPEPTPSGVRNASHVSDPANYMELLRMENGTAADGRSRLELLVERRHLRSLQIIHGGAIASLMDSVMGLAAGSVTPSGHYVVTIQLNVNFVRPAWQGERLVANGEMQHTGQKTAVGRAEARTTTGTLVATGAATFMFLPIPAESPDRIERRPEPESR